MGVCTYRILHFNNKQSVNSCKFDILPQYLSSVGQIWEEKEEGGGSGGAHLYAVEVEEEEEEGCRELSLTQLTLIPKIPLPLHTVL